MIDKNQNKTRKKSLIYYLGDSNVETHCPCWPGPFLSRYFFVVMASLLPTGCSLVWINIILLQGLLEVWDQIKQSSVFVSHYYPITLVSVMHVQYYKCKTTTQFHMKHGLEKYCPPRIWSCFSPLLRWI